ncbi:hypothetical protein ON010_g14741 [Phytophthora cinnamomi]|nr:hypothetical protein ON010_g14741 [Phytophthora cinnamomi]
MWRKVGVLALLAMALAFVHDAGDDGPDACAGDAAPGLRHAGQAVHPVPEPDAFYVFLPIVADYFAIEAASWSFGILFLVLYFVGKAQNRSIADKWLEEAEPVLRTQFSYTGSSVQNGMGLIEESRSNFKYFCTGRRFLTRFVADLETIDVGLHGEDVDPFILGISKKLGFTALSKDFPELLEHAKQVPVKEVPESMWVATDCTEIPKAALTHSLQASIKELEDFVEYIVITDMNKQLIVGMPKTQRHVLRVRFKLWVGSKKLDVPKALQLVFALVDGAGATIKLSPNVRFSGDWQGSMQHFTNTIFHRTQAKHSATKRRLKIKQAADALASAKEDEVARRQTELNEKKQKEYESLSYEEQQKIDAKNEKRATRKRFNRKASLQFVQLAWTQF